MNSIALTTVHGDTWQGATFNLSLSGTPVNITGATIKMQVRKTTCSDVVLEWSTEDDTILLSNPSQGQFQLLSRDITITPSTYGFDCQMILSDVTSTIFKGTWTVTEDYTR